MVKEQLPMVTIGIPTLGREQELLDTIKMVLGQNYQSFEVLVADQSGRHGQDFTSDLAELKKDRRLRYFLVTPQSLPAARNFILEKSKGEIILFIDDDVVLEKDFVSTHAKEHLAHPEASVIAGRIKQEGLPLSDFPLYFDKYGLPQGTFNCASSGPCATIPGGNHSARITALKKIGGYHTAYKKDAVREESDMGFRLHTAGYKMFYSADAKLVHLSAGHGGSRIYKEQFDDFRFYVNDLLFMLRTVSIYNLPVAIFRRLRIYTGGPVLRRFKRAGIFICAFMAALWLLCFERNNYASHEVVEE